MDLVASRHRRAGYRDRLGSGACRHRDRLPVLRPLRVGIRRQLAISKLVCQRRCAGVVAEADDQSFRFQCQRTIGRRGNHRTFGTRCNPVRQHVTLRCGTAKVCIAKSPKRQARRASGAAGLVSRIRAIVDVVVDRIQVQRCRGGTTGRYGDCSLDRRQQIIARHRASVCNDVVPDSRKELVRVVVLCNGVAGQPQSKVTNRRSG